VSHPNDRSVLSQTTAQIKTKLFIACSVCLKLYLRLHPRLRTHDCDSNCAYTWRPPAPPPPLSCSHSLLAVRVTPVLTSGPTPVPAHTRPRHRARLLSKTLDTSSASFTRLSSSPQSTPCLLCSRPSRPPDFDTMWFALLLVILSFLWSSACWTLTVPRGALRHILVNLVFLSEYVIDSLGDGRSNWSHFFPFDMPRFSSIV
jgi:hypothetical protein